MCPDGLEGARMVRRACGQNVQQTRTHDVHVERRRRRCRRDRKHSLRRCHIDVKPAIIHTDVHASAHACRPLDRHRTALSGGRPLTRNNQSQRHPSPQARSTVSTLPHRSTSDTSAHHAIGAKQCRSMRVVGNLDSNITAAPGNHTQMWATLPISESFHKAPVGIPHNRDSGAQRET